jgi:hypothetical protein
MTIAWSAGVSAAAVGLAALFAVGKSPLDHILSTTFTIIGVVTFLILLSAAVYKPCSSSALALTEIARSLARERADQARRIDPMPVGWKVTDDARQVMPIGLSNDGSELLKFAGEFSEFGVKFMQMRPEQRRVVILGDPGAGRTTLISRLCLDLEAANAHFGVPVIISAARWGGTEDIIGWIAERFKVARARVVDAMAAAENFVIIEDLEELPPALWGKAIGGAAAVRSSKSLLLPSPDRALRLQQRHTLTILLWERTSRIGLVWLVFGSVIAVAYGAYELVAVSCRLSLGGRHSASDVFSDARLWLACTRRLPWRTMTFLAEAERLGILRLFGGVYRFRHIRLEQRLLIRHAPSRVGATDRAAAFDAGKEAPEVRESSPTDL